MIDSLVRKPGAFENYRYKDGLFPSSLFRVAYDQLIDQCHRRSSANKQYVKILELAAMESQSLVQSALKTLMDNNQPIIFEWIEAMVHAQTRPETMTDVFVADVDLGVYDQLLEGVL